MAGFKSHNELLNYLCSPKGCRYFQSFICKYDPLIINEFIQKFKYNFTDIMICCYANYFFQKFVKVLNLDQRLIIIKGIKKDIVLIASDFRGTHSIQALLEVTTTEKELKIIYDSIINDILIICKGLNSNHMIQKIITCQGIEKRALLNQALIDNTMELIVDSNGVCVVNFLFRLKNFF